MTDSDPQTHVPTGATAEESRTERDAAKVDTFRDNLVTGSEQWWHFLDRVADDEADAEDAEGLELQEVNPRSTGLRPSSRAFRCRRCGGDNPADMTFCVFCGAQPSQQLASRTTLVVISAVEQASQRRRIAEIFADAHRGIEADELQAILEDPPVFFFVDGAPSQIESVMERLDGFGVDARAVAPGEPSGAWYREVAESCLRDPGQTALFGGTLGLTALASVLFTLWLLIPGLALFAELGRRRKQWYVDRFRFPADALLNAFAGLNEATIRSARNLLHDLRGDETREYLTVCLMEYYAIWNRLESGNAVHDQLLERLRGMLTDLVGHVIDLCERYAELHMYLQNHAPAQLREAIDQLEADGAGDASSRRRLRDRRKQLATSERIEEALADLRTKLRTMAASVESLRARSVSFTSDLEAADAESVSVDVVLGEIEDEMEVVDETLAEIPSI